MDANEAREIASSLQADAITEQYDIIQNLIAKSANLGKTNCSISGSLLPGVETILTNEGFKFTSGSQYNETYTNISW